MRRTPRSLDRSRASTGLGRRAVAPSVIAGAALALLLSPSCAKSTAASNGGGGSGGYGGSAGSPAPSTTTGPGPGSTSVTTGLGATTTTTAATGPAGSTTTTTTTATTTASTTGGFGGAAGNAGAGGAGSTTTTTTSGGGGGVCGIGHLLISEVRSRGKAGGSDEFVELYNPTAGAVTLDATWTLEGRSASAGSYNERWKGSGKSIPSHGHYLVVGSAYAQAPASDDALSSGITDATSVRLLQSGNPVDAVCYYFTAAQMTTFAGASYTCSGTPVSNLPHNDGSSGASDSDASLSRKVAPGGGECTDTGDNASDFVATAPSTPEDAASPPAP